MARERQRSYWRRLNYHTKKPKGRSARLVMEEMEGGTVKKHSSKSAIENTIRGGIHQKICYLSGIDVKCIYVSHYFFFSSHATHFYNEFLFC